MAGSFADNATALAAKFIASDSVHAKTIDDNSSRNNESKSTTMKKIAVNGDTFETETVKVNKTAVLRVHVVQKGADNLPIKGARVIVTYDDATEFERKTDKDGVALLSGLPYGNVDVDVTSSGRLSDGEMLVLDEPERTLTFRLKSRY